jgi:hypothetical protein
MSRVETRVRFWRSGHLPDSQTYWFYSPASTYYYSPIRFPIVNGLWCRELDRFWILFFASDFRLDFALSFCEILNSYIKSAGQDRWRDPAIHALAFIKSASNAGTLFRVTKCYLCQQARQRVSSLTNHIDECIQRLHPAANPVTRVHKWQ